jgi:hypothetical protein
MYSILKLSQHSDASWELQETGEMLARKRTVWGNTFMWVGDIQLLLKLFDTEMQNKGTKSTSTATLKILKIK